MKDFFIKNPNVDILFGDKINIYPDGKFNSFKKTLRESKYGVIAGILLGFARSLGEFGATVIFAGNIQGISRTIPLAIFQSIQTGNDNDLGLLIFCSVGLGFLAVLINYFLINKSVRNNRG